MLNWKDVLMAQEHSKDLLREAEQARLAQQAGEASGTPSLWHRARRFFAGSNEHEALANEQPGTCSLDPTG